MAWKYLERFPPPAVRILARRRQGRIAALSDDEIAITSGLPVWRVREIAFSETWDAIPYSDIKAFCHGCGFDPFSTADRNRALSLERYYQRADRRWQYLKNSGHWEDTYLPLINILNKGVATNG
jgi:hypothetical protein